MSYALKSNTTLIELDLSCEHQNTHTNGIHQQSTLFVIINSTGNSIEETGATSLSYALKSNTTLTQLDLMGEDNTDTNGIHQQSTLFSFPSNEQGTTLDKEESDK